MRTLEPGLRSIAAEPAFAIGQQALLVPSSGGNVLWECISLIDDATIQAIHDLGGLTAIAVSHPHYYDCIVEWSRAFGDVPIYLHAADREWVMRPDENIVFWDGAVQKLDDAVTVIHCGGHFEGSAVLHWAAGAAGQGVLLPGDTIQVAADREWVTFMRSYPNMIPLSEPAVRQVLRAVQDYPFDRLYGIMFDRIVATGAGAVVTRSAERYIRAISG